MKSTLIRNLLFSIILLQSFLMGILFMRVSNIEDEQTILSERIDRLEDAFAVIMNPEPGAQMYEIVEE